MSLELFKRGNVWWVRGRPADGDQYVRESLRTSDEELAQSAVRQIEAKARKRRVLGADAPKPEDELTFAAAVMLYPAGEKDAAYLKPLVRREGKTRVKDMTPTYILQIGPKMMPKASTDTWHRQIVTPIRSVINNAHGLGKCPPIRVRSYSEKEMVRQDVARGRQSRVPKAAGSWEWLLAFRSSAEALKMPHHGALAWFMFRHGYRIAQSVAMTRSADLNLQMGLVRVHASKGHPAHVVELDPDEVAMIANLPLPRRKDARDRVFGIGGERGGGSVHRQWKRICKHAGIAYLSPHQAGRHGYGTEMIVRQRIDPVTAADGKWADPSVMLRTYAHAEDAATIVRDAFRAGKEAARTQPVQSESTGKRSA